MTLHTKNGGTSFDGEKHVTMRPSVRDIFSDLLYNVMWWLGTLGGCAIVGWFLFTLFGALK